MTLWGRVLKKIRASRPLRALVRAVEDAMPCASLQPPQREALEEWKRITLLWLSPADSRRLAAEGQLSLHEYLLLCNNRSSTVSVMCDVVQTCQTSCMSSVTHSVHAQRA